jgi:hypothetical protein
MDTERLQQGEEWASQPLYDTPDCAKFEASRVLYNVPTSATATGKKWPPTLLHYRLPKLFIADWDEANAFCNVPHTRGFIDKM